MTNAKNSLTFSQVKPSSTYENFLTHPLMKLPSLVLKRTSFGELAAAIALARQQLSMNDVSRIEHRGENGFFERVGILKSKRYVFVSVDQLASPQMRKLIKIANAAGNPKFPCTHAERERDLRIRSIYTQIMNPALREDTFIVLMGDRLRSPQAGVWHDKNHLTRFLKAANDITNFEFISRFLSGR